VSAKVARPRELWPLAVTAEALIARASYYDAEESAQQQHAQREAMCAACSKNSSCTERWKNDYLWAVVEGQNVLIPRKLLLDLRGVGDRPRSMEAADVKGTPRDVSSLSQSSVFTTIHWIDHYTSATLEPSLARRHPQFLRGYVVYEDLEWVGLADWVLAAQHYKTGRRVWERGEPERPTPSTRFWFVRKDCILYDSRTSPRPGAYYFTRNGREYTRDIDGEYALVSWIKDDTPGLHWVGCTDLHCDKQYIENGQYLCSEEHCLGRSPTYDPVSGVTRRKV
jgi:hypothetical protein